MTRPQSKTNKIHTVYKLKDGTRVPSVTTILHILGKEDALLGWAWQCGIDGLDYKKVRDQASAIGTAAHDFILHSFTDNTPDCAALTPQDKEVATSCFESFKEWSAPKTIEPIMLEVPLVSETYRYGGTLDFYGKIDGVLTLLDFKTSGGIYPEYFYQLAAYKELLLEKGHSPAVVKIVRFGKSKYESVEERVAGNLDAQWKVFLACRNLYDLLREARR